jgi:hypothetical protein
MTPAAESFLLDALKPAPSLAVLAWVVWKVLTHLKSMETSRLAESKARDAALVKLGDNCHAFQQGIADRTEANFDKMSVAFDKNTEALGRNSELLHRVDERILKIDSHLRKTQQQPTPTPEPT